MEFIHLQTEMKQRSQRTDEELKQTLQQARFQQDNSSIAEQNNLQLRWRLGHIYSWYKRECIILCQPQNSHVPISMLLCFII